MKGFSAVAYFFGKKISDELNVPVGLINASWGGTPAEVWTPVEKIQNDTVLLNNAGKVNKKATGWPWEPGSAYNAMIAPLTNFNISGAIWYQGESNVGTYATYKSLMTTLIDSWRDAWKEQIPFYYVQIAPFNYGDSNINGALLQEAQTQTLDHPNVGMAVITDLVDSVTNIHPTHKREVGNRLANWALAQTYRKEGVTYKSPMLEKAVKEGDKVQLSFTGAANGLKSANKKVVGFMISDHSGQWYPADAKISRNTITVWHKKIKDPAEVRYAFTNTLIGNVFSTEGLPLTPFRTGQL
jgi:sialate O-acetylesterase